MPRRLAPARVLAGFPLHLLLVTVAALAIRVVAVLVWSRWFDPQGDQNFYWRQGQDLAQGYGFVYRNNVGERVATAVHPPLYSAYLGLVGLLRFPEDSHAPFRLATALLGSGAVALIGLAGRRIAGARAGIVAAVIAAVYPNLWINDAMMLSESMFALTIALVVLLAYRFVAEPTGRRAGALGGAIALAALTRAEALLLFVLLAAPLVVRATPEWRDRVVRFGAAAGAGALLLAPWVVRNAVTFEQHPITLSTGAGFVIEISNCDQTYGLAPPTDAQGNPTDQPADRFLGYWAVECDRTPWPPGDETVVEAAKRRTGLDYIDAHRDRFPVVVAARIGRIWDLWRPGQSHELNTFFERRGDRTTVAAMTMYYPLLAGAVAGLVVLWRRKVTVIPFVALAVMTTLTAAVSFGITRYRVGAEVGLTILAAVALDAVVGRVVGRGRASTGEQP